jgi:hypothetical protein
LKQHAIYKNWLALPDIKELASRSVLQQEIQCHALAKSTLQQLAIIPGK